MYDVVALGELLIDFVPGRGAEGAYPVLAAKPGGAPGNYLAALAAYGMRTAFIGKVGADLFGELLIDTMRSAGVETKGIVSDETVFTTLAFVTLDAAGNRSFSFARKPGADTCLRFDEVDRTLIDMARAFHFGTLSLTDEPARTATRKAVTYARARGKLITFDPNLRLSLWRDEKTARQEILWGLDQADVVKISDDEAAFLWDCSPQKAARILLGQYGIQLAMITMGKNGCYLANGGGAVAMPCPPVRPVDTTGAGDIFGGAALSRILRQSKAPRDLSADTLRQIAAFAGAAASLSTEKFGAIPSIPQESEVIRVLRENQMDGGLPGNEAENRT